MCACICIIYKHTITYCMFGEGVESLQPLVISSEMNGYFSNEIATLFRTKCSN